MVHNFPPIGMSRVKKTDDDKAWWRCGEVGTLVHSCWDSNGVATVGNSLMLPQTIEHRIAMFVLSCFNHV